MWRPHGVLQHGEHVGSSDTEIMCELQRGNHVGASTGTADWLAEMTACLVAHCYRDYQDTQLGNKEVSGLKEFLK